MTLQGFMPPQESWDLKLIFLTLGPHSWFYPPQPSCAIPSILSYSQVALILLQAPRPGPSFPYITHICLQLTSAAHQGAGNGGPRSAQSSLMGNCGGVETEILSPRVSAERTQGSPDH